MSISRKDIHAEILTFECFERLKHLNQLHRAKDIGILRSNLDDDLEILTDIYPKHLLHTCHRLFSGETTEVVD